MIHLCWLLVTLTCWRTVLCWWLGANKRNQAQHEHRGVERIIEVGGERKGRGKHGRHRKTNAVTPCSVGQWVLSLYSFIFLPRSYPPTNCVILKRICIYPLNAKKHTIVIILFCLGGGQLISIRLTDWNPFLYVDSLFILSFCLLKMCRRQWLHEWWLCECKYCCLRWARDF